LHGDGHRQPLSMAAFRDTTDENLKTAMA